MIIPQMRDIQTILFQIFQELGEWIRSLQGQDDWFHKFFSVAISMVVLRRIWTVGILLSVGVNGCRILRCTILRCRSRLRSIRIICSRCGAIMSRFCCSIRIIGGLCSIATLFFGSHCECKNGKNWSEHFLTSSV